MAACWPVVLLVCGRLPSSLLCFCSRRCAAAALLLCYPACRPAPIPHLSPSLSSQAAAVFEWRRLGNYGAAKKLFREGQDACLPHAPLLAAHAK